MSIDAQLFVDAFKAQMALGLNATLLLQESRQRWLEQASSTAAENIAVMRTASEQVLDAQDWRELLGRSGSTAWRLMDRQLAGVQSIVQTMIINQSEATADWQRSVTNWQRDCAVALGAAADSQPKLAAMSDWVQLWGKWVGSALAQGHEATAGKASHD